MTQTDLTTGGLLLVHSAAEPELTAWKGDELFTPGGISSVSSLSTMVPAGRLAVDSRNLNHKQNGTGMFKPSLQITNATA